MHDFGQWVAQRHGVAVDASIHAPHVRDPVNDLPGGDARNWHAHVLTSTREVTPEGFGAKTRALDDRKTSADLVEEIRGRWAEMTNKHLAEAGHQVRVDHRSYERQGIEITPTKHVGQDALNRARNGQEGNRVADWRESQDAQVIDLQAARAARQGHKRQEMDHGPGARPRSFAEAADRAKGEHAAARRNRDGLRNVPGLPVAAASGQDTARVLPADASGGLGAEHVGDRPALPGQREPVSAGTGRADDLRWLKSVVAELEQAKTDAERDQRPVWKGPDGQERPLYEQRTVSGHLFKGKVRFGMDDARAAIQKDYPSTAAEYRHARADLQEARARSKDAGFLGRLFSPSLRKELQDAEMKADRLSRKLGKMDRAWQSPKAQAWAADLIQKGDRAHDAGEKRVEKAEKRQEAVSRSLDRQKDLLKVLESNPGWTPSMGGPSMDRAERLRKLEEERRRIEEQKRQEMERQRQQLQRQGGAPTQGPGKGPGGPPRPRTPTMRMR